MLLSCCLLRVSFCQRELSRKQSSTSRVLVNSPTMIVDSSVSFAILIVGASSRANDVVPRGCRRSSMRSAADGGAGEPCPSLASTSFSLLNSVTVTVAEQRYLMLLTKDLFPSLPFETKKRKSHLIRFHCFSLRVAFICLYIPYQNRPENHPSFCQSSRSLRSLHLEPWKVFQQCVSGI